MCCDRLVSSQLMAQVNDAQLCAWYLYFCSVSQKDERRGEKCKFGLQGDIQHGNWNVAGKFEQILLRGGVSYQPAKTKVKLTLGYAHITTGGFGESDTKNAESRPYQAALIPHRVWSQVFLTHQRFMEATPLRTRFWYAVFMNIPLNNKKSSRRCLLSLIL